MSSLRGEGRKTFLNKNVRSNTYRSLKEKKAQENEISEMEHLEEGFQYKLEELADAKEHKYQSISQALFAHRQAHDSRLRVEEERYTAARQAMKEAFKREFQIPAMKDFSALRMRYDTAEEEIFDERDAAIRKLETKHMAIAARLNRAVEAAEERHVRPKYSRDEEERGWDGAYQGWGWYMGLAGGEEREWYDEALEQQELAPPIKRKRPRDAGATEVDYSYTPTLADLVGSQLRL